MSGHWRQPSHLTMDSKDTPCTYFYSDTTTKYVVHTLNQPLVVQTESKSSTLSLHEADTPGVLSRRVPQRASSWDATHSMMPVKRTSACTPHCSLDSELQLEDKAIRTFTVVC